jgi:hypothetical protein
MGKKYCKASPPCGDCPKGRKNTAVITVDRNNCQISYFVPRAAISISGQRG